jgi:hypothetical protein
MAAAAGSSDGVVKHLLLARFKEEVTPERLDDLIRRYAHMSRRRCSTNCAPDLVLVCESRILLRVWPIVLEPIQL